MLTELSQWRDAWRMAGNHKATVLEVHFGSLVSRDQERTGIENEVTKHLESLLDYTKPQVLHVHHNHKYGQPSNELLPWVNERHYLMHSMHNTMTMWSR